MMVLMLALAIVLGLWAGVMLAFAGPLAARWREPVLRHPVLIIESDDWGAGPLRQAEALSHLSALLQRVRDRNGHPAVMTLGVVLEVPDGERIAAAGCTEYHALPLADARFDHVRDAIQRFQPMLSLHGHIHESRGSARIGRTLALNPGSSYEEGILQAAIVNLDTKKRKVKNYQLVNG